MAKKRSPQRRRAVQTAPQMARWQQLLLLVTVVPMLAGIFLFVASWFDIQLFGTPESQTIAGALLALLGFAAANALQKLWRLALGWLLIAVGVWLATAAPGTPLLWAGVAVGAVGLALVLWAFVERYRQVRSR